MSIYHSKAMLNVFPEKIASRTVCVIEYSITNRFTLQVKTNVIVMQCDALFAILKIKKQK